MVKLDLSDYMKIVAMWMLLVLICFGVFSDVNTDLTTYDIANIIRWVAVAGGIWYFGHLIGVLLNKKCKDGGKKHKLDTDEIWELKERIEELEKNCETLSKKLN